MPPRGRSNPGFGLGGPRYPGTFLLALRVALGRVGWEARRWLGHAVDCVDDQGREQVIGLENLFRRIRREERDRWPDLIADYLATVPQDVPDGAPQDLDEVADRVLVRLSPPVARQEPDLRLWTAPVVEKHVVATLVVDAPNSMAYVTEKMIEDSGKSGEEWLRTALKNLRDATPERCFNTVHDESGLLQSEVGDAYDTSRALLLDELLPGRGDAGFLIALPGRDHLLVLPVGVGTLGFVPWLRSVAVRTHRTLPYPITPEIFWVHGGRWHLFSISQAGEQMIVQPPAEFVRVLQRLAGSGEADDGGVPI